MAQQLDHWHVCKHPKYGNWCVYQETDGGSHSIAAASEADAHAKLAKFAAVGTCGECGDVLNDHFCEPDRTQIRERQRCHSCLFWLAYVDKAAEPSQVVVEGRHYVIAPDAPRAAFQGHGGARFDIRFNDGREVTTHNLWAQGRVPEHFRDRLPDNAEFVQRGRKSVGNLQRGGGGYVGAGSADACIEF